MQSLPSLRSHYAALRGHYAVRKSYMFEAKKTLNFAPKRLLVNESGIWEKVVVGPENKNKSESSLFKFASNWFQV